jgi:hypothetical protein
VSVNARRNEHFQCSIAKLPDESSCSLPWAGQLSKEQPGVVARKVILFRKMAVQN